MNQIIQVAQGKIGSDVIQTVNARELHEYLGNGKYFTTWIQERIAKYGFIAEQDFTVCFPKKESESRGGQNMKEYHVSITMAKELSMVENNLKGQEARRYFIECEKKLLNSSNSNLVLDNPVHLRAALLSYTEQVIHLTRQAVALKQEVVQKQEIIEQQIPAVTFVKKFVERGLNMCLRDAWKGLGLSPTIFTRKLVEDGILFRNKGGAETVHAKQAHIKAGHFVGRLTEFGTQTLATPKGIEYIAKKYNNFIIDNN